MITTIRMLKDSLKTFIILLASCSLLAFSCNPKQDKSDQKTTKEKSKKLFQVISPERNQIFKQTSTIEIEWKLKDGNNPDSIKVQLEYISDLYEAKDSTKILFAIENYKTGIHSLRITFYSDSLSENHIVPVQILADNPPKKLKYKVLNTFAHDTKAYTQGLFIIDGYLYESTGRRTESSLRKVNPSTGEVVQIYNLQDQYFGEGITKIGNEIFMLTYTAHLGFIFDFETFELKREFPLQTMQGWGLTTIDDKLLLSDGTSKLHFYEPEDFSLISSLDVCTDKKFVEKLNELEYTNNEIFANVYTTHKIVRIDPETGAVTGTLDLSDLYPKDITFDYDHVLNGIAWDKKSNTFYITGKYWPVLYQIQIAE